MAARLSSNPFVSFAPWIVFWVVASPHTWEYGAGAALLVALVLSIPSVERRSPKILDLATIAFFAILTVLGLLLDPADLDWLENYAQGISSAVLALIAIGSLVAGTPFTEQYARESTPREYWTSPTFKQINRMITLVWGAAFAVCAVCGFIAGNDGDNAWVNWILPIGAIVAAVKFTAWYPERGSPSRGAAS